METFTSHLSNWLVNQFNMLPIAIFFFQDQLTINFLFVKIIKITVSPTQDY
jgi:hypothetical protein